MKSHSVKAVKRSRLAAMVVLLTVAFASLGYRLVDLQVFQHDDLKRKAQNNTQKTVLRETRRGEIRDRRGNLLAGTVFVKTVNANPAFMGSYAPIVAQRLAPWLEMSEEALLEKLQPRTFQNAKGETKIDQHVVLKRKVSLETWDKIQAAMKSLTFDVDEKKLPYKERLFYSNLRTRAIFCDSYDQQQRIYPNNTLAAHVLGFVSAGERETVLGTVQEITGADGVERVLNSVLRGVPGWRSTEVARSRELVTFRDQDVEARDGQNVVLTIDAGLQHIVESELMQVMAKHTPVSVSAVVVQPKTGEILALANLPTFDPNRPGDAQPEERRNRAITDVFEPGSTFKIVAASAALNERQVTLQTRFDCEGGYWLFAGRRLKDDHPAGILSVEEIIAKSSNIGTAKIAVQLGAERLYDYIRRYGFGSPTGIPLLGEVSGLVYPPKKWSKLSVSRIPIGHGIAVTPLQMAMAMSAVANGGRLMRPILVSRIEDDKGQVLVQYAPQVVRQVISESTAQQTVAALKSVVSTNGTARRARLEHYTVAGKTGTAQKPVDGSYSSTKFFASFIGFFPAENPELCVAIVIDEPKYPNYYGGSTAAPAFKNIAERAAKYLAIKPDVVWNDGQIAHSR